MYVLDLAGATDLKESLHRKLVIVKERSEIRNKSHRTVECDL